VLERGRDQLSLSHQRLRRVDTVKAMTVHKAQGSQFERVALLLPEPSSPILTRELLYTAATRAQQSLLLVGTEASVRAAVERPIARASGLRELLWS
jgi:exodeoxyribonuclease V alpha subunit